MRYEFYEAKRLKLIETVQIERQKVMFEEENGEWINPRASRFENPEYFLNMEEHAGAKSQYARSQRSGGRAMSRGSAGSMGSPNKRGKSSMIEKEKAQLEKIR